MRARSAACTPPPGLAAIRSVHSSRMRSVNPEPHRRCSVFLDVRDRIQTGDPQVRRPIQTQEVTGSSAPCIGWCGRWARRSRNRTKSSATPENELFRFRRSSVRPRPPERPVPSITVANIARLIDDEDGTANPLGGGPHGAMISRPEFATVGPRVVDAPVIGSTSTSDSPLS